MMRKILVMSLMAIVVLVVWSCDRSSETIPPPTKTAEKKPSATAEVLSHTITDAEVDQAVTCPVMGTKFTVGKDTLSAEYKGKVYYFCCGGCPKAFKNNPEKYAK